ncbi:hypothetical protein [Streptomyces sp. NPDC058394]|uniref:hypothetical protein n=1 Tax=Streptomyces sp. NPDC058394 TaxID=3346477 RepID=UPI003665414C
MLFQTTVSIAPPPTTWTALEQVGRVLLCGIAKNGPTTQGLQTATAASELHAVVADVVLV